jgi:hypothetical protein
MPFIAREDIAPEVRGKYEAQHKTRLREALLNPGLTAAQRIHLREQIRSVGKPKVYSADTPPKPGAISFT